MPHPRYSGPLLDCHCHFDHGHRDLAPAIARANGVAGFVNLWDLEWPPPDFPSWKAGFGAAPAQEMVLFHTPDLSHVDAPDFADRTRRGVEEATALGAGGLKVWKNLGLGIRDASGALVAVDDPRLAPVWEAAGDAGLPVAVHTADPVAFFEPLDERNARYRELSEHPDWWFGRDELPSFCELLGQFERIVARHPQTTFVGVHMGHCAEDLGVVGDMLERLPNYFIDTSARVGEIGRQDPAVVHDFFVRFQDRILFGSDVVRTRALTLPEEGLYAPDLRDFYDLHWQFFETDQPDLTHPFPIQGAWTVHGIDLPNDVLKRLYHENAARVIPALATKGSSVAS